MNSEADHIAAGQARQAVDTLYRTESRRVSLLERGELKDYRLAHAARADLCRRLAQTEEAWVAYERALKLTEQAPERRFLQKRPAELKGR